MFRLLIFNTIVLISFIVGLHPIAMADNANDSERIRYEALSGYNDRMLFKLGEKHAEQNPDSALLYYDVLINRYSPDMEKSDARLCAEAMLNASKILYHNFNYSKSMEMLLKCWKVCEKFGFQRTLTTAYRMIGNIYSIHYDYDSSIGFYSKSLSLAKTLNDTRLIHMALSNLMGATLFNGDLKKAHDYYDSMKANRYNDKVYTYDLLVNGALLEMFDSNIKKGIDMLRQGGRYAASNGFDVTKTGAVNSWIAQGYSQLNNTDSTLYYLHKNEHLARASQQNDLLAETLHALSDAYKKTGNRAKYLKYLEEYLILSEHIFDQKKINSLKNTQFQYELDKSDRIIRNLDEQRIHQEASMRIQRIIIITSSLGLIIVLFLLIIIFFQKRRISKAFENLYKHHKQTLSNERNYLDHIRSLEDEAASLRTRLAALSGHPADISDQTKNPDSCNNDATDQQSDISPSLRDRISRGVIKAMESPDLFCDPTFSIAKLAEVIGSNTSYVSKYINETFGMNFRNFLNEYRIKESMIRLAAKEGPYANHTIKAIGESVGFKSQSAYIAAFTKFCGMKPSAYQTIARKDCD